MPVSSHPLKETPPLVTRIWSCTTARMVLVLPAPLRPTRQTVSPSRTSRSTPCSARLCPYAACRSESFSMSVPRSEVDVLHFPMPGDFIGSAFGEYLAPRHDGYTLCQPDRKTGGSGKRGSVR